jgi:hypothetical protein
MSTSVPSVARYWSSILFVSSWSSPWGLWTKLDLVFIGFQFAILLIQLIMDSTRTPPISSEQFLPLSVPFLLG